MAAVDSFGKGKQEEADDSILPPIKPSEMDVPTPMFPTYDDPDVAELSGKFEFTGAPNYHLPEPKYPEGYVDRWVTIPATEDYPSKKKIIPGKWHTHWAADSGGWIAMLMQQYGYRLVTQQELPGYMMMGNLGDGNAAWDNRICHHGRSGIKMYLMKCPRALYEARQKAYRDTSQRRIDFIEKRQLPESPGGLSDSGFYSPEVRGGYRINSKLTRSV